ncbi:SAVED domain-containing protein [Anatilimnocola sp. NA78]|uniref:SAVED domain-containing protein n=1 Tax=Anatilimnocola sp. NA78 TaxID=3415683 RepID=UPI003CE4BE78
MPEAKIDFAIVTALAVEREAFVRRLENCLKQQFDDEPLTFYTGMLKIPGETYPYTVVLTQLLEMGISDAAIAVTRVISRWHPRNILMIGIAGGVEGKAKLGDVLVSQYAYYYEPGKATTEGFESRGRQFNSDLMLYGRAQHYEAAEWMGEIHAARPDALGEESALPTVRFGPIACGEQVIASIEALDDIKKQCPKMIGVAMEGAGAAKGVLSSGDPPRYLEIRGVSDYAGPDKNDGWHEYAANTAAAFTIGFLRSRPFPPGPPPEEFSEAKPVATLVMTAQSLRPISKQEILPALDEATRHGELEFFYLDFLDLVNNKSITDPEAAAQRLADPQGALLGAIARRADARLAFHGLCAIPPVILAGHIVTDRRKVALFDFQPDSGNWIWPGTPDGFAALNRTGTPKRNIKEGGDVIIRMPISYPIHVADTDGLGLKPRLQIELAHPAIERGVVKSEAQVREYGRVFRETLDLIRKQMPACHRIHLFYAGPMSLAFHIGQQISENIHPPVVVWNFSRKYEWGIDFAAAMSGEPCVIRPKAETEGATK